MSTPPTQPIDPIRLVVIIGSTREGRLGPTPVGFVSYGGVGGGLRGVEQLRLVFAELHSTTVRETVSFHKVTSEFFAPDGPAHDPEGAAGAAKAMLDQLDWWARALRTARTIRPYST